MQVLRLVLVAFPLVLLAACCAGPGQSPELGNPLPPLAVHPSLTHVHEGMSLDDFRTLAGEHWPAPSQPGAERTDIFTQQPPTHSFTLAAAGDETLAIFAKPYLDGGRYAFIFTGRRLSRIVEPPRGEIRTITDEQGRRVAVPVSVSREERARRTLQAVPMGFADFAGVATDRAWREANASRQNAEPNYALVFADAVSTPLGLLFFWRDDPDPEKAYAEHLRRLARFDAAQLRLGDTRGRVESLFGLPIASTDAKDEAIHRYGSLAEENQFGLVRVLVHFDRDDRVTKVFTEFQTPWSDPEPE